MFLINSKINTQLFEFFYLIKLFQYNNNIKIIKLTKIESLVLITLSSFTSHLFSKLYSMANSRRFFSQKRILSIYCLNSTVLIYCYRLGHKKYRVEIIFINMTHCIRNNHKLIFITDFILKLHETL